MQRSLLVQALLNMATGNGGAKLEALVVDAAGTFDAGSGKGYNPVTVPSGTINVLGEKGVVSNNSVVVTPKAQVVGGWLNSGETSGSGVGVTASELVSGSLAINANGTFDVTNYAEATVNVESLLKFRPDVWYGFAESTATSTHTFALNAYNFTKPIILVFFRRSSSGSVGTHGICDGGFCLLSEGGTGSCKQANGINRGVTLTALDLARQECTITLTTATFQGEYGYLVLGE